MTDNADFSSRQIVLSGDAMPAPRTVVAVLRENLHQLVTEARATRGEVHAPEDTYALIRSLMAVREGAADYEFAFTTIRKEVDGFIQDDLELAVGEQDGVPNSGMKVPDVDGTDIQVDRDTRNQYDFDGHALAAAVTFSILTRNADMFVDGVIGEDSAAELLIDAMDCLISMGRFQPQVTKVRAFTDDVARMTGGAPIASTARSAVSKSTQFRGIKVERKQPK